MIHSVRFTLWSLFLSLCVAWLQAVGHPGFWQWMLPEPSPTINFSGQITDYFSNEPLLDRMVDGWYQELSPTARVGQLIMPAWDKGTARGELEALISQESVGGFMLLRKDFTAADIAQAKQINPNPVPLLVASDAEPSLLKYRFSEPVFEGETAELDSPAKIKDVGQAIASELQEYGINLNFAPVYDVGTNQNVLAGRMFSLSPIETIGRANQFANVMLGNNIIPTAKHFPGHGQAEGDTHQALQSVPADLPELPLFKAAVQAQVPLVMVGHLAVDGGAYDTAGRPATLAPVMMQQLLREELGFQGVIITDAMNMQAVSSIENADLKALYAGADIILMPADPAVLNQQIQTQMLEDEALAWEVEQKVKRVLRLKLAWLLSERLNEY